ncbi:MAG: 4Fe-4S dicluster domain-containing protein [Christensenellales bacterium]|jgi:Pyruvate/2-oxoacid:ferredoxin oxidoreductase delta subunit
MTRYVVSTGCTLCGMCAADCPEGAVTLRPGGARIDPQRCIGCGICYRNCASEAIQIELADEKKEETKK